MRSSISHFSAWIAAALCLLLIELTFNVVYKPSPADRTNFIGFALEDNFIPDQMEQIIWQKLRMTTIEKPDFVQVGDSSGFFGIMPEVVERYLPGMKYLNSSCCATQGFNGYLALLHFQLSRFPSIKYMVVHMGVLGAFPGPTQWRGAPKTLDVGFPIKTMGENMETFLAPPWNVFNLPTNALRQGVLQATFLSKDVRESVNQPRGPFETIISGLNGRQGYGLEQDHQTGVGDFVGQRDKCVGLKYETFFDWRSLSRKSYLDAFVEEYVGLAREFKVTPILYFQISPCEETPSADVEKFRANLKQLEQRFPELRAPVDVIDSYPENNFSVPLHVQRNVAEEVSRRLGRTLRDVVAGKKPEAPPVETAGRELEIRKVTRTSTCSAPSDLTPRFAADCGGKEACGLPLAPWRDTAAAAGCVATYTAEFSCSGGPTRIVRQEGETRFNGRMDLDCARHDRWPRDEAARGILVADAALAGEGGTPMGPVTLRVKAFCDGLTACDYTLVPPDSGPTAGAFTVRWYCGEAEKNQTIPNVGKGGVIRLECPAKTAAAQP